MSNAATSVFEFLQRQGLSKGAAAGVIGNLLGESSLNPGAAGDYTVPGDPSSATSHGIAQWHASRWENLKRWAQGRGMDPNALATQQLYLVHEMQSDGVWAQLQQTSQTDKAAKIVMDQYEVPKVVVDAKRTGNWAEANKELRRRIKLAADSGIFGTIKTGNLSPDTSGTATATGGTVQGWSMPGLDLFGWQQWATKGLFVVGGLAIVVVGFAKLVAPSVARGAQLAGAAV